MIRLIDTYSYNNKLRAVSPMWKCGFAAVLFALATVSHPPVQLAAFVWMAVWTVARARIPLRHYMLLIGSSGLFYAASVPALVLELVPTLPDGPAAGGAALLSLGHTAVILSDTGVETAGKLLPRIAACLSAAAFVIWTTPMSELFQVMSKLRFPALLLELMLVTYRYLFVLTDTARDMMTAQRARGGQLGFKRRLNDTAMLIVRLFARTMQRYRALAYGLAARGFTDEIKMAPYRSAPVAARYWAESGFGVAVLAAAECWLRWKG